MPIIKDLDHLPAAGGPNAPLRTEQTVIVKPLLEAWWEAYKNGPHFVRDKAIPELPFRASMMGDRCDRQLWYEVAEVPETDPTGISNYWRMRMGQLIHDEIASDFAPNELDDKGAKHGWWNEEIVDLRPAGYPGSSHSDLVYYDHGSPLMLAENKSVGGFGFKSMATKYGGDAEGARWAHILQALVSAVALDVPMIVLFYIAPESVSPSVAKSNDLDEYGRFAAEWHFMTADLKPELEREIRRHLRILGMATPNVAGEAWLPERTLDDPSIPAGAYVTDPDKGKWDLISPVDGSVVKSGTKFFCDYCHHRKQCIEDGPEMKQVTVKPRPPLPAPSSRLNDKLVDEGRS